MLFTGPFEHRHLVHLLAFADVSVVPSIFPEAFGMVAAESAAAGCPPIVARHSGLAEVAAGLEQDYPDGMGQLAGFTSGDSAELAERITRGAVAAGRPPRRAARGGAPGLRRAVELVERRAADPRREHAGVSIRAGAAVSVAAAAASPGRRHAAAGDRAVLRDR